MKRRSFLTHVATAAVAAAIPVTVMTGHGTVIQRTQVNLSELVAQTLRNRQEQVLENINSHNSLLAYLGTL